MNPDYEAITSFQKGQASRIFKEVKERDKVLIVKTSRKTLLSHTSGIYGSEKKEQISDEH